MEATIQGLDGWNSKQQSVSLIRKRSYLNVWYEFFRKTIKKETKAEK